MMFSTLTLPLLSLLCGVISVQAADVWTVNCGVLSSQRSDPIVFPGGPASHVHAISGGTAFRRNMAGKDAAVASRQTTCDKFTDHSNYWAPQLYHMKNGMFELVPYTGVHIYYKRFTCSYQPNNQYCKEPRDAQPFPPGLRMLAGDPERRTQNASIQSNQAILFETGNSGEIYGFPKTLQKNLQINVRFPSCWDGVNVDSPDHKSHMAYPDPAKGDTMGGMCPKSHPVAVFHMGAEFGFDTAALGITDSSKLVFSNGDTTGFGGHGDFLQGWTDLKALGNSFNNCNGIREACAWNSFGTPDGKMGQKSNLKPETPPVFEEEIGLNGPISKLPGNNPVYNPGAPSPVSTALSAPVSTAPVVIKPSLTTLRTRVATSTPAVKPVSVTAPTAAISAPVETRVVTSTSVVTSTQIVVSTRVVTHTRRVCAN